MPQAVEVVGQAEQERLAVLHRQATSRSAGEDLFSYTFAMAIIYLTDSKVVH